MIIQFENAVKYFRNLILDELSNVCITWVCGGCVRDYFSVGKMTSDIDLYFTCKEDFDKSYNYFIKQTKVEIKTEKDGVITIENKSKPLAKVIFENDNVTKIIYKGRQFDLVKKYFNSPSECIAEFDFTVCCGAVDIHNVYTHDTFFIDLSKRQLMINKLPYPLSTMWRMQKYIKKGFTICSVEMLKLSKAIGELQTNTEEGERMAIDLSPLSEGGPLFTSFD